MKNYTMHPLVNPSDLTALRVRPHPSTAEQVTAGYTANSNRHRRRLYQTQRNSTQPGPLGRSRGTTTRPIPACAGQAFSPGLRPREAHGVRPRSRGLFLVFHARHLLIDGLQYAWCMCTLDIIQELSIPEKQEPGLRRTGKILCLQRNLGLRQSAGSMKHIQGNLRDGYTIFESIDVQLQPLKRWNHLLTRPTPLSVHIHQVQLATGLILNLGSESLGIRNHLHNVLRSHAGQATPPLSKN
mmetsp:Transcript_23886/g.52674  ORF Transcript_23886/g.52674 Transcript_23886/m.52674 type:complete len:241 (-) Transcript_23886:15-737(-)